MNAPPVIGVSTNGVRIPLSRDRIAAIAKSVLKSERVANAMLSIAFVNNRDMRALNRSHLHRNGVTDVIAFAFRPTARGAPIVGDVYIAPQAARASARVNGVTFREEIVRLVVHGALHVLGYDHPETDARVRSPMWRKQERLVKRLAARK